MKKIYISLCLLLTAFSSSSFAQTVTNGGMETWRNSFTFSLPPVALQAPSQWYGVDSLILTVAPLVFGGTDWHTNLFKSTSFKHSGTASAKIMSRQQDTLGIIPGFLVNAKPTVNTSGGTSGSIADLVTFSGGETTTLRTQNVSAWVAYFGGVDTATHTLGGDDTGLMLVQAYAIIAGVDSMIGTGVAEITKSDTFYQVNAPIFYMDTTHTTDLVRITFISSMNEALDSSTLYVDDVEMTGTPQTPPVDHTGVSTTRKPQAVSVYPNPATNTIFFDNKTNATVVCRIFTAEGRIMGTRTFTGNTSVDVSAYAAGSYLYVITDEKSNVLQSGKVSVAH